MNSDKGPWLTFLAVVVGYTFLFPFLPVLILSGAGPGSGLVNWLCANLAGTYMLYSFLFLYAGFVLLAVVVDRKLALGGFASFPFVLGLALVLTGLAVNVNVLFVGYVYLVDVGPLKWACGAVGNMDVDSFREFSGLFRDLASNFVLAGIGLLVGAPSSAGTGRYAVVGIRE